MAARTGWARVATGATVAAVALGLSGCVGNGTHPRLTVPRAERDLVGHWYDREGRELPNGTNADGGILVLRASAGSTTCSEDQVTVFVELAWPPGRRLDWTKPTERSDTERFVRSTDESGMKTDGESDQDTSLPARAVDTGINREGNTLYADESDRSAIWVRRAGGTTERWARLGRLEGCA